jgi:hypothetical protein
MLLALNADTGKSKAGKKPANDPEPVGAEALFTNLFSAEYGAKFAILRKGVKQRTSAKFKLPFLLSEEFNSVVRGIQRQIRSHFARIFHRQPAQPLPRHHQQSRWAGAR